jgi:hypothetical protein
MDSNQDKAIEADVRRAVLKAFREILKDMESEPKLIIEFGNSGTSSEESIADIRAWLFKRR